MTQGRLHTIVALVENRPGVLNKIASKWRQRGFNIESLTVGHSETPGLSRMTFTVDGAAHDIEQVTKQLFKVIEVVKVSDVSEEKVVARELALIKVNAAREDRGAIIEIGNMFRANIVDVGTDSLVLEATGNEEKIDALLSMLEPFGVRELVRTGRVAMVRGGTQTVVAPSTNGNERHFRSAGEGKPKLGSLI
ncbi:MAG TPA: acetolactate synthase small subunit [Dehalococcoidia bacterium]|nr:acetolactate synthase small subunit [Dehalococcoidia bacterium]